MPHFHRILLGLLAGLLCTGLALGNAAAEEDDDSDDDKLVPTSPYRLANLDTFQQPPAADPSTNVPGRTNRTSSRSTYARLARAPNMFGDSQLLIRTLGDATGNVPPSVLASFSSNSVGSRKIAENEKVMPMDRVFFGYNEFHGVAPPLSPAAFAPPVSSQLSRCTMGFEKTFFDGTWSTEARLAMSSSPNMTLDGTQFDGGVPAALTLYLKNLSYSDGTTALGAGLGIGVPVTSDVILTTSNDILRYREQTLHLMPYVGFMSLPTDNWFFNGFLQLDFASGENQLDSMGSGRPSSKLASIPEQHLLFADLAMGRWLYRDEDAPFLSGLAAAIEFHYLTTLTDADPVTALGPPGPMGPTGIYTLSSAGNRVDVLNLTAGLQFQFGQMSNLRVAAVAPMKSGFDRLFDGELQVSFNRQF